VPARDADLCVSRPADAQDIAGHAVNPGHARHRRRGLADGCGGDGFPGLDADARARTGLALAVVAAGVDRLLRADRGDAPRRDDGDCAVSLCRPAVGCAARLFRLGHAAQRHGLVRHRAADRRRPVHGQAAANRFLSAGTQGACSSNCGGLTLSWACAAEAAAHKPIVLALASHAGRVAASDQ
jgi:hypothetical protein